MIDCNQGKNLSEVWGEACVRESWWREGGGGDRAQIANVWRGLISTAREARGQTELL